MSGRVRLAVAVVLAVAVTAGGVPISAQQAAPGALQARAGLFASIQGTAVNWTNAAMANAPIRLRDARLGRVIRTTTSDKFGSFEFRSLEPGSYVAELLTPTSDAVLAASPIVNVGSGDTQAVLVKVPFKTPPAGGLFGNSLSSALAITAAAAAAGVLATSVAGAPATPRALPGQP